MKLLLTLTLLLTGACASTKIKTPEEIEMAAWQKRCTADRPILLKQLKKGMDKTELENKICAADDEENMPDGSTVASYTNGLRPMNLVFVDDKLIHWEVDKERVEAYYARRQQEAVIAQATSEANARAIAGAFQNISNAYKPKPKTVCRNVFGQLECQEQ